MNTKKQKENQETWNPPYCQKAGASQQADREKEQGLGSEMGQVKTKLQALRLRTWCLSMPPPFVKLCPGKLDNRIFKQLDQICLALSTTEIRPHSTSQWQRSSNMTQKSGICLKFNLRNMRTVRNYGKPVPRGMEQTQYRTWCTSQKKHSTAWNPETILSTLWIIRE
jgi:hypothetical protein